MEIRTLGKIEIHWEGITEERTSGRSGFVDAKTVVCRDFRIRRLSFSENYEADHWCRKGHIIFVLSGGLILDQKGGPSLRINADQSLVLGNDASTHKVRTKTTTVVLIID